MYTKICMREFMYIYTHTYILVISTVKRCGHHGMYARIHACIYIHTHTTDNNTEPTLITPRSESRYIHAAHTYIHTYIHTCHIHAGTQTVPKISRTSPRSMKIPKMPYTHTHTHTHVHIMHA